MKKKKSTSIIKILKNKIVWTIFSIVLLVSLVVGYKIYTIRKIDAGDFDYYEAAYFVPLRVVHFGSEQQNVLLETEARQSKDTEPEWLSKLLNPRQRKVDGKVYRRIGGELDFNQDYFVTSELITNYDTPETLKFNMKIYSLKDNTIKEIKTVSVLDIIKKYDASFEPIMIRRLTEYEGKTYVIINAFNKKGSENNEQLYINIDTNEVEDLPNYTDKYEEVEAQMEFNFFNYTNFSELNNTFGPVFSTRDIEFNNVDNNNGGYIENSSIMLVKKNNEIKESIESGNFVQMKIYEDISADTLAHWLVPEGKNPYEGVTLKARNSLDGEDHNISSIEEFLEWYKY